MTKTTAPHAEFETDALGELVANLERDTPLSPDEVALLRWLAVTHGFDVLTQRRAKDALNQHRERRDKRRRSNANKEKQPAPTSKKHRKQTPAQRARRLFREDAIEAYKELLCDFLDPIPYTTETYGGDFATAYEDWLISFTTEAGRRIANSLADRELSAYDRDLARQQRKRRPEIIPYEPPERELSEADRRKANQTLQLQIDDFAEGRREAFVQQIQVQRLWSYYEGSYASLWEQAEETLREQAALHDVDLGPLFAYHRDEILQYMRNYRGLWPLAEAREALRHRLDVLEDSVAKRLEEERQFQRLVSLYSSHENFSSCFPVAREMKRRIEFFCGPTNSGKTHAAMNELASGSSGVYLAPLRLLALEGQANLIARGVKASFLTGEERDLQDEADFVSSTIEMLDYDTPVETAIIDEIQLLGDPQRGWAWTNALVGVPAERIILTGSEDAVPLIQAIGNYLGEEVVVRRFERFNSLEVLDSPAILDAERRKHLEPGTAIICFSRRDVLELKQEIERTTQEQVSVIYGGLAPEVRREEARRFRERETDLLVATDAISMGLNLPIRTVLFWQTFKYYNHEEHPLRDTEIKQIAGRAGRYGLEDRGYVGAFHEDDLDVVARALAVELPQLHPPCLVMPLPFHIELLAEALHTRDILHILRYFSERIWFAGDLFQPMVTEDMMMLARMLEEYICDLPLTVQFTFVCAPVNMRAHSVVQAHLDFAYYYGRGDAVPLPSLPLRSYRKGYATNSHELRNAEDVVHIVTLYQWLWFRFGDAFVDIDEADEAREIVNQYIARSLQHGRVGRRCKRCDSSLPTGHRFGICEQCFRKQRNRYNR